MSTTSALPRQTAIPPRPQAPSRPVPASPAAGSRPAGRFRGDLATDQWWWSPELYDLLGAVPGQGQPSLGALLAPVHPVDCPGLRAALSAAGTVGTPVTREYRVTGPGGADRTLLLVCEPETDGAGRVTALTGLVVEVGRDRVAPPADEQLHRLETEVEQLRSAMASRAAIEQAKGVLMLLVGCGEQVAFDLLAHISSHTHRKVRDVAAAIIDSARGQSPLPDDVREILHDATPPGRATA
ncbi:ANTAR domain-containing protein [Modestobacter versicolor]|uniref:ANTAR domain-containing protein n=1 Tax=Modestobacter versicolor TaxID=429133 RepID=UPI0034DE521F